MKTSLALLLTASFAAAQPAVMLFDQAHGSGAPREPLTAIAQKQNFTVNTASAALSAESLRGTRLLFLCAPSQAFAPAEKEAVIDFVKDGGRCLS